MKRHDAVGAHDLSKRLDRKPPAVAERYDIGGDRVVEDGPEGEVIPAALRSRQLPRLG
jgi:hypothetical protein